MPSELHRTVKTVSEWGLEGSSLYWGNAEAAVFLWSFPGVGFNGSCIFKAELDPQRFRYDWWKAGQFPLKASEAKRKRKDCTNLLF